MAGRSWGISELQLAVYHSTGKVTKVTETKVYWIPEQRVLPWTSGHDEVEVMPVLAKKSTWKAGQLSQADRAELRLRFPEVREVNEQT